MIFKLLGVYYKFTVQLNIIFFQQVKIGVFNKLSIQFQTLKAC